MQWYYKKIKKNVILLHLIFNIITYVIIVGGSNISVPRIQVHV